MFFESSTQINNVIFMHFSKKLNCPILPILCFRDSQDKPVLKVLEILEPGMFDSHESMNQVLAKLFEKEIRKDPGLWLLFHKRFET